MPDAVPALLSVTVTGPPSGTIECVPLVLIDRTRGTQFFAVDGNGVLAVISFDASGSAMIGARATEGGVHTNARPGDVLDWYPPPLPAGLGPSATVLETLVTGADAKSDWFVGVRRYYLLKRKLELLRQNTELASFWRSKQEAVAWPALPATFPARAKLIATGYTTVRDLDGAPLEEILGLGLTRKEALEVLAAMESWHMIPTTLQTYIRQDGRTATIYNAPLMPDTVFTTASGHGDTYEMGELRCLRLTNTLVAFVGGTNPALRVIIETSHDGATNWQTAGTFATQTVAGALESQVFPNCDRFVRVTWAVDGSPTSVEFSVLGEAV